MELCVIIKWYSALKLLEAGFTRRNVLQAKHDGWPVALYRRRQQWIARPRRGGKRGKEREGSDFKRASFLPSFLLAFPACKFLNARSRNRWLAASLLQHDSPIGSSSSER